MTSKITTSYCNYTIRPGYTLSKIARNNGTTVKRLVELNNITDQNKIMAGATLKLSENNSANVATTSSNEQTTDGTLSNATQTRNENMKNLKTAYDTLMKRIDIMDLPEGIDRAKFKEDISGGYQAHIMNNDFPDSLANPAEFATDLMLNALNNVENGENLKTDIIKLAAGLLPNDKIGGISSVDAQSGDFTIETNSEGDQILVLNEDIKKTNTDNIKNAYQTILSKLDTMELPTGVKAVDLKTKLAEIYPEASEDLPEGTTTPAEFAYSLLQEAFKGLSTTDVRVALVKLAAQLYPDDAIGGQKCSDLKDKPFSIVENTLIL